MDIRPKVLLRYIQRIVITASSHSEELEMKNLAG